MATWGPRAWDNEIAVDFLRSIEKEPASVVNQELVDSIINAHHIVRAINSGEQVLFAIEKDNLDVIVADMGSPQIVAKTFGWLWDGVQMYGVDDGVASSMKGYASSAVVVAGFKPAIFQFPPIIKRLKSSIRAESIQLLRDAAICFLVDLLTSKQVLQNWYELPSHDSNTVEVANEISQLIAALKAR